jgi:hypothetical protein
MKKLILSLALCAASFIPAKAQSYISICAEGTNTAGTMRDRSNLAIEVGKQYFNVFTLGFDYGRSTLSKVSGKDTANYVEFRPNLNIFQQGKFTNTITIGAGYVFNAEENFCTELSSGVEYALNSDIHFNINFGQYFYSGNHTSSNCTFFGVSVMKYFNNKKKS